uniref:Uncharacterized protein n=1 Tax=Lepeophtheirus salmonis TaxID=72036 RepID=A0A0K2V4E3_LEPSM
MGYLKVNRNTRLDYYVIGLARIFNPKYCTACSEDRQILTKHATTHSLWRHDCYYSQFNVSYRLLGRKNRF